MFDKYQHVERFGTLATKGIEDGMCFVFPKIDGTNASLWFENNILYAGSRNRSLELDNDNAGFYNWAINQENIIEFFLLHPELRLFGEWLVPHTLTTYEDSAWKRFYVFDVMVNDIYLTYEQYQPILELFKIDYIPPICKVKNPTYERLVNQLDKNLFLIKDGLGTGEGIVIKNYEYKNKFGRVIWAKIVKNEFKSNHQKVDVGEIKEKKLIEEEIAKKYVTETLVNKEFSKIENESGWESKYIPKLLNTVFYCLITEESWNFIKEFKNPIIDYKYLHRFTTTRIKELKPELF